MMKVETTGSFTLPGEAGCEELTLQMAKKWGADVIRDSDGTELSDEILNAGYGIYSTICIIRDHNEWARQNPQALQQSFLCTKPELATAATMEIKPMAGFYPDQFKVNDGAAALPYWQVYDRTTGQEVPRSAWQWNAETAAVTIQTTPFHAYTVSFLAYRVWEEISMYNHVTNHWDKEHLMPIDPRTPAAQAYLSGWLDNWCKTHPHTTVVRFTSMFYNFVWMWGSDERNRTLFSDWGSYDFTVSEKALADFEAQYGYALTAEDFINKGDLHVTHMPPDAHKRDYMDFTQRFVAEYGSKLVKMVQSYGKKAYVFYDDSWVGTEPYGPHFKDYNFDGIIKCVFSGFEVRLCAGVKAEVHELRLHPYLFPVGLGGAPTFAPGGNPTHDAKQYWSHIRRALLRAKIDRIGLGGYLHLLKDYPDFVQYIADIGQEFRTIKALHESGAVYTLPITVAVLHSWGDLRSWTLSGHFHETFMHDLIHINEALSGLPVQVKFISFADVKNGGALKGVDVVINAGRAGTAWSGGDAWADADLVAALNQWVFEGGVFLGVNEPSALPGYGQFFRMAEVLGIDEDTGARVCHGRYTFTVQGVPGLFPQGSAVPVRPDRYLLGGDTTVLAAAGANPTATAHRFGKGMGLYLTGFDYSPANARLLLNLLLWAKGLPLAQHYLTDNAATECAWFPADRRLVVWNNTETAQTTTIQTETGPVSVELAADEHKIITL